MAPAAGLRLRSSSSTMARTRPTSAAPVARSPSVERPLGLVAEADGALEEHEDQVLGRRRCWTCSGDGVLCILDGPLRSGWMIRRGSVPSAPAWTTRAGTIHSRPARRILEPRARVSPGRAVIRRAPPPAARSVPLRRRAPRRSGSPAPARAVGAQRHHARGDRPAGRSPPRARRRRKRCSWPPLGALVDAGDHAPGDDAALAVGRPGHHLDAHVVDR